MMRLRFSFIGMLAMAVAVLLLAADTSLAQRRGGGSRGGSRGGGYRGGYYGGYYGGYSRGYYPSGGWGYPGYYNYGYNRWYGDGYYSGRRSYYYDYQPGYYYSDGDQNYYDSGSSSMPAGVAPMPESSASTAAVLNITVPPDAEIWVQGAKMSGTGTRRQFVSPPLERGEDYEYKVQARWMENGREVTRTRTVDVHAGDRITVDLTKQAPAK